MLHDFNNDTKRLFKSVPKAFDPRKVGTLRIGSLSFYREHYDEEVADKEEGTGSVSIMSGQSVTLSAVLASALLGLEIMGKRVQRLGGMVMRVSEPGLSINLDVARNEVTIRGSDCTWEFTAADALVFCMTAPSKSYTNTFSGERIIWSIDIADVDKFAALVVQSLNQTYSVEASFPFLSAASARSASTHVEHGPVRYVPRKAALDDTANGRLAALLFTSSTFIKPSGPPKNFEKEEEYRFQLRRVGPNGQLPQCLPKFVDIPFAPVKHLVKFG